MVTTPQVIVPVEILERDVIPDALIEFLSAVPVVLLGYHEIPEQTLTEQARDEYGERTTEELAALVEAFESYGGAVETELVFTHDPAKTIQRVADDIDRGVILRPNPVQTIEQVIVAVRRDDLVPAITATAAALLGPADTSITLLYATTADENEESGRRVLTGMTTTLEEAGISKQRLTQRVEPADDVETVLLDASSEHDLIVLGEDDPGIMQWLFGTTTERVAEQTLSPVLVVQRSFEN